MLPPMGATTAFCHATPKNTIRVGSDAVDWPRSVCDLVDYWADKQPDHPAILCGSKQISYRQLNEAAARVAWLLTAKEVQHGDVIPVLATRTYATVVSFLGVLKAGACYVPIDVDAWGEVRTSSTLKRVSARVVINLGSTTFPGYDIISRFDIESTLSDEAVPSNIPADDLAQTKILPDDLVYIVFTSGTTSTPKGVMIPHRALLNYVQQGDDEAPFNTMARPEDKSLLTFSPGFDAGTGIIFSTICNGAQLIMSEIVDFESRATEATIVAITPSMLSAIQNVHACSRIRTLIIGGEPPTARLIERWTAPGRSIYNGYGPTETTVGSLMGKVEPSKPITLGRPMSNSSVVLLDGDIESDYGEICLTGPGLALGYYKDQALTSQKFIYWNGIRMYRSGDFARRTEHGLEYAGRADSFVKNRGLLVNIDSQVIPILLSGEADTATAFMYRDRLVAFVTPETIDTRAFRQSLTDKHDSFIVPDLIRAIPSIPLTPNGKADNRALQVRLQGEDTGVQSNSDLVETPNLKELKMAVSEATSCPVSNISSDSTFFDLGGNSLAALKVLSHLRRKQLKLGIKDLFDLPSLMAVSEAIQSDTLVSNAATQAEAGIDLQKRSMLGPMSNLQTKMIRASLKVPGANTMLLRIVIPHQDDLLEGTRLSTAWRKVLHHHSIFRTIFDIKTESQYVRPDLGLDWEEELTTADQLQDTVKARSLEMRENLLNYKIRDGFFVPVNQFRLITIPSRESTLLFSSHHAQADGWSLSIIIKEVQAIVAGNPSSLHSISPGSIDVASAQRCQQLSPDGMMFWTSLLEPFLDLPKLRLPKPPPTQVRSEWTKSMRLDLELTLRDVDEACRPFRIMSSTLFYVAWGLVMSNYASSDRVAFGAVFSGRNLANVPGIENAVGPLLNTVPFPINFELSSYVKRTLSGINSQLLQMLEFQWSATEAMTKIAGASIDAMMQTLVVTEYDVPPSIDSRWIVDRDDIMEFELTLLLERSSGEGHAYSLSEKDEGLQARILYDSSKYTEKSIHNVLAQFRNALIGLMSPNNEQMMDVRRQLLSQPERRDILNVPNAFGVEAKKEAYSSQVTVKDRLETAAITWPDVCAIEIPGGSKLTYRELATAANKVATRLSQELKGRSPRDEVVGVLSDGSVYWVIGILAVIKAGYICCPIDVNLPQKRIQDIAKQSGASFFISATQSAADRANVSNNELDVRFMVDQFLETATEDFGGQLQTATESLDVFYLIFTSGSTGVPKGVPLHNLSVLNFLDTPEARLFAKPGRRVSQLCSLGFDMVLVELFASLCYGATLVLKDASDPLKHLKQVDAVVSTPSLLSALDPEEHQNLDVVLLAGEPVTQALADMWSARVPTLMNFYGPSECGCVSSGTRLLPHRNVSIGKPLSGMAIYILDHHQCLVPQGVVGELYIAGFQTTRGYWNEACQVIKTSQFLTNPFSTNLQTQSMYRTGDLAFWDSEMNISYVGRVDNMVKIRGFRVELEEVENALITSSEGQVKTAAAIAIGHGHANVSDGNERIVALVTPVGVDLAALRHNIRALLPSYACPSQIIAISKLPRTANSKLDRQKLRDIALTEHANVDLNVATAESPETRNNHLSSTELKVASVWHEQLQLPKRLRIRKDDDFISLGGNSILSIKAARSITTAIGHNIPLAILIRETVLKDLARAIDEEIASSSSDNHPPHASFSSYLVSTEKGQAIFHEDAAPRPLPLSYLEDEMYRSWTVSKVKSPYNTVVALLTIGSLDREILASAFTDLVRHHPVLRSRYFAYEGRNVRIIAPQPTPPLRFAKNELSPQMLQDLIDKPFNLEKDQLLKVVLWEKPESQNHTEILLITHHIITDKASLSLMLQWVSQKYAEVVTQRTSTGPAEGSARLLKEAMISHSNSPAGYLEWTKWLTQQKPLNAAPEHEHSDFWKQYLRERPMIPQLRLRDQTDLSGGPGLTCRFRIPLPSSGATRTAKYSQRIAVAATALALHDVYDVTEVLLGLPYENREDPATANIVGFFLERLPLRIRLDAAEVLGSCTALLDAIAADIALCLGNQLPYHQIKDAIEAADGTGQSLIDVMVVYDWQSDSLEHSLLLGPDIQVIQTRHELHPQGCLFPLTFGFVEEKNGDLAVNITYNTKIVSAEQIQALRSVLVRMVQGIALDVAPKSLLVGA
ncbi:non-ribosomal peptide synthetase [Xylariaceae sp. FL1019]|nr:non-ribosomal peptide synthetase [Xylariaceae sp. FL1019]